MQDSTKTSKERSIRQPRQMAMLLALICVQLIPVVAANNSALAMTTDAWSPPTLAQQEFHLVDGVVVFQDDQPVPRAVIRISDDNQVAREFQADASGRFEIKFKCKSKTVCIFYSADKMQAASLTFLAKDLEAAKKASLKVTLDASEVFQVQVTKHGKPVANATVGVWTNPFIPQALTFGETNPNGEGSFFLPKGTGLNNVWAWSETQGIDIKETTENTGANLHLELRPTRAVTVTVIDENDQPVSGQIVLPTLRSPPGKADLFWTHPAAVKKSDELGQVVFQWMPSESDFQLVPWVTNSEQYRNDGTRTLTAKSNEPDRRQVFVISQIKKVSVRGIVIGATGESGPIRVTGMGRGFEKKKSTNVIRFDSFETTTNARGEFEVDLIPGIKYAIGVTDDDWTGRIDEVVIDPENAQSKFITVHVQKATPLSVNVTSGEDQKQLENVKIVCGTIRRVELARSVFDYFEIAETKTTDANGRLTFGAANGEVELTASYKDWSQSKVVLVKEGRAKKVSFRVSFDKGQTVTGRVVAAEGAKTQTIDVSQCDVRIVDLYKVTEVLRTTTGMDGDWKATVECEYILVQAHTADKKHAGLGCFRVEDRIEAIELVPTVTVAGTLVDEDGEPIADKHLVQIIDAIDGYSLNYRYLETKTDAAGRFEFTGVLTGIPQRMSLEQKRGVFEHVHRLQTYSVGQDVTDLKLTLDD